MRDWKRYEEAKRLRDTGLTLRATGAALGISGDRVRQMLADLERRQRRLAREAEDPSHISWKSKLKIGTRFELERCGFETREDCMVLTADELTIWRGSVALPGWERDKKVWSYSKLKLSLAIVNEVRALLGAPRYAPAARVASGAELERARKLLERHGWRVEPPNVANNRPP